MCAEAESHSHQHGFLLHSHGLSHCRGANRTEKGSSLSFSLQTYIGWRKYNSTLLSPWLQLKPGSSLSKLHGTSSLHEPMLQDLDFLCLALGGSLDFPSSLLASVCCCCSDFSQTWWQEAQLSNEPETGAQCTTLKNEYNLARQNTNMPVRAAHHRPGAIGLASHTLGSETSNTPSTVQRRWG